MKSQFTLQKKKQMDKQWIIFNVLLLVTYLIIARLIFCTIHNAFNKIEWIALTSFLVITVLYVICVVVRDTIKKN